MIIKDKETRLLIARLRADLGMLDKIDLSKPDQICDLFHQAVLKGLEEMRLSRFGDVRICGAVHFLEEARHWPYPIWS